MSDALKTWRMKRIAAASAKAGGDAALGKLLGYASGAYVRQMKAGERAITEKTVAKLEAIHGYAGWFSSSGAPLVEAEVADPAASTVEAARPTLEEALTVIAEALNALPVEMLELVGERLKTMAMAPDSTKARSAALAALSGELRPPPRTGTHG